MTPKQVEFCYHIAYGNVEQAQALLPNLIGTENFHKLAIFCFWGAQQSDPQAMRKKLPELYPNVPAPIQSPTQTQSHPPEETVCLVLVPVIKPQLRSLLKSILQAEPDEIRDDYVTKAGFEIVSCAAALKFILSHRAFKDNADDLKSQTTRILNRIFKLTTLQLMAPEYNTDDLTHDVPNTVKAVLQQSPTTVSDFHARFPGLGNHHTADPTRGTQPNTADKLNYTEAEAVEVENEENIDPVLPKMGASKVFLTHRPIYGLQREVSTHTHMQQASNSKPQPPIPNSLHQALSLEMVASRFKPRGH